MSIMSCRDVTMTSPTAILNFEAAILNSEPAVIRWQWRHRKIYEFVLRNILIFKNNQKKHTKVKDYLLLLTNKGKKDKVFKIHSWVDGCYGNVNHLRHIIDTGNVSLINLRKSQEIWWLFVWPFKSYNSLKSARAQCSNRDVSVSQLLMFAQCTFLLTVR